MYSGTTLRPLRHFDAWFGAHQKIDRVAREHLGIVLPEGQVFPKRRQIIKFEGFDGPDGIKRKSPAKGELWHYIDPTDDEDRQIVDVLKTNYRNLVAALKENNETRAAFEAAWLAHGIVDGLTPAHHYPYEEEMVRLRGGEGIETRTTPKEKVLMPGENLPQRLSNNWQMWGDKGLLATHIAFELGIAVMITPLRLGSALPTKLQLQEVWGKEMSDLFVERAKQVSDMQLYERFYTSGWTPGLAKRVRRELLPIIVNTVTLIWYMAAQEAYAD
ncbi:MAG TPA: hypothetical protein VLF59_05170 [Candidatus Saccharimonadales bacterium]|nr:hypothetical protein [Candidatus Saccharimonadales bacterium]